MAAQSNEAAVRPSRSFLLSLALVSAAALGYEILLMRLLSIVQWHHFAYMIISLALLGYGASGTFLTLAARMLEHRLQQAYFLNAVGFSVSSLLCVVLAQRLPFNPFEMMFDPRQSLYLMAMYLLLAAPFFCAANCVGLAFRRCGAHINRLYAADLLGAGAGALTIVVTLSVLAPEQALRALVLVGGGAAVLSWSGQLPRAVVAGTIVFCVLLALAAPAAWTTLASSPYKGLNQALAVMGSEMLIERDGPLGRLSVIENNAVPFRIAPGVSLTSRAEIPPQLAVFSDGDGMSAITHFDGERDKLAYLGQLSTALPYALLQNPSVLVIGAGGGSDVLQAIYFGARHIDAVEFNSQMARLVRDDYAQYSGGLFQRPDVTLHIADARHFIASAKQRYDLLQFALVDSFAASSAGVQALNETNLYTVEAFEQYFQHLAPNGLIAVTRWLQLPPRDSLKLLATAIDALESQGVAEPGRHLALIRSWKTTTLLIGRSPLSSERIASLRTFCRDRGFDPVYFPGISIEEVNQFNLLDEPHFYQGAMALLSLGRSDFEARYKFNLTPARDDQPYFFHFFKWGALPDLLSLGQQGGFAMLEWGYLLLLATLIQALLASALLIGLPLLALRREATPSGARPRVIAYFSALGLAYLFIEISFIQKFVLFLGHPVYSAAATICAFLIFSGLGSAYSKRLAGTLAARQCSPTRIVCTAVACLLLAYLALLPAILDGLLWLPDSGKFVAAFLLLAPLAFFMGMPFPLGLAALNRQTPALLPWAWGINGCASVISAVLAVLLAVHWGFFWVGVLAAGLYLMASRQNWT